MIAAAAPAPVRELEFGGRIYRQPYRDLLPPLTAEQRAELKEELRKKGIQVAVVLDQHGNVLDGNNRLELAVELELDPTNVPFDVKLVRDEEHAAELAADLNLWRRHLTQAQRHELIGRLRAAGLSTRQVAKVVGVDSGTVSRVDRKQRPDAAAATPERSVEERRAEVVRLAAEKVPQRQIAEQLGVSLGTVAADLKLQRGSSPASPQPCRPTGPSAAAPEGGEQDVRQLIAGYGAQGKTLEQVLELLSGVVWAYSQGGFLGFPSEEEVDPRHWVRGQLSRIIGHPEEARRYQRIVLEKCSPGRDNRAGLTKREALEDLLRDHRLFKRRKTVDAWWDDLVKRGALSELADNVFATRWTIACQLGFGQPPFRFRNSEWVKEVLELCDLFEAGCRGFLSSDSQDLVALAEIDKIEAGQRPCAFCEELFEPVFLGQDFCSTECGDRWRGEPPEENYSADTLAWVDKVATELVERLQLDGKLPLRLVRDVLRRGSDTHPAAVARRAAELAFATGDLVEVAGPEDFSQNGMRGTLLGVSQDGFWQVTLEENGRGYVSVIKGDYLRKVAREAALELAPSTAAAAAESACPAPALEDMKSRLPRGGAGGRLEDMKNRLLELADLGKVKAIAQVAQEFAAVGGTRVEASNLWTILAAAKAVTFDPTLRKWRGRKGFDR